MNIYVDTIDCKMIVDKKKTQPHSKSQRANVEIKLEASKKYFRTPIPQQIGYIKTCKERLKRFAFSGKSPSIAAFGGKIIYSKIMPYMCAPRN